MTAVLQEIHSYIDEMPESKLIALREFLRAFLDEPLIIETNLTDEEKAIIEASMKRYDEHPEEFTPLKNI